MRYLLDVSTLLALGIYEHEFHFRVESWAAALILDDVPRIATCSITELGFVRIASQVSGYGFTVETARRELLRLKESTGYDFQFIADNNDISHLPKMG